MKDLTLFSRAQFMKEFAQVAATFYSMICASIGFQPEDKVEGSDKSYFHIPSCLQSHDQCLMFKNQRMSAFQYVVGSAKKMSLKYLNNMGLSMSSDSVHWKTKER